MPIRAPIVTTPVPPTPVSRMPKGRSATGATPGSGRVSKTSAAPALAPVSLAAALPLRRRPPSTVTKLGQKPSRQEKSLLQLDWSIWRLRPNSVSFGTTETQFDFTPQSPQPSQTASLMTTRLAGSGKVPRLRRRRFSAAQVWS